MNSIAVHGLIRRTNLWVNATYAYGDKADPQIMRLVGAPKQKRQALLKGVTHPLLETMPFAMCVWETDLKLEFLEDDYHITRRIYVLWSVQRWTDWSYSR
jgi:hypothetical protein